MTSKIAITPRSLSGAGHPALSLLTDQGYELVFPAPGQTPTEDALLSTVPGCVGWLAGVEPIPARVLDRASELRVISRNGVGVNNIDLTAAKRHGIVIERAAGTNARGVAELAVALMLAGFRHVPWSDAMLHQGKWERRKGIEAEGRTLGVIGCGAIGQTITRIALGLGMRVLGHDPYPPQDFAPEGFEMADLRRIFAEADAISLHCPPSEQPLINTQVVAGLKPGVVLINTARAELIDEAAVLAGLEADHISCLATDVFRTEPPEPSALLAHDRVIMTPHAGGFTEESVTRATETAVRNLLKVLAQ